LTPEQQKKAREEWERKYGKFKSEGWKNHTIEICFYEDSFEKVKPKIREIAEGIANESNLPHGSKDQHEEGGWITIKDGKLKVIRWPRDPKHPHRITPTHPIPPSTIGDIHSHPENIPGANSEPTVESIPIGPEDKPGAGNGGPDAPMRPEHVSFVVDHENIYWIYWVYQCKSDGSVKSRRVCVKSTKRKVGAK
jgi:hypothetical protein